MKIYRTLYLTALISILFLDISCVAHKSQSSIRAGSNYEKVFNAAISALGDIGFSVVSSDINSGGIVGEKAFVDSERGAFTHRLNISVESAPMGVKVVVTADNQPVAIEDNDEPLKRYLEALKKRAPAYLNVVSR